MKRLAVGLAVCGLFASVVGALALRAPVSAAAAGYAVSGMDVSAYQGAIDWNAVATANLTFAYLRASEQNGIPDERFAANYSSAKGIGMYAGAYHRARPDVAGGRAQADYFISQSQYVRDGRTLPPMLDIEWPRSNWSGLNDCYNMTPAQLVAWIREFVDRVFVLTGVRAVIYTNPNWWNPCTANNETFGDHPLFNSGYLPSPPPPPSGWSTWTFWQYTSSASVPGVTGGVDGDVFNGDYLALARLAGGSPFALHAHANDRLVVAEDAGRSALTANRVAIGPWERFDQVPTPDGYVALRSHANGLYVTAENAGSSPLIANRAVIGLWEKFSLVRNGDGSVSFRAAVNNRYVVAEDYGNGPLIANRTAIGDWERFDYVLPSARIALFAMADSRYVVAEDAGAAPLIANRTAIGLWEQFNLGYAGGGYQYLRAQVNGRYVVAENAGTAPLIADRTAIGLWEQFRVIVNTDGTVSLMAKVNNRYVVAENAGAAPLIANRSAIGLWERFRPEVL